MPVKIMIDAGHGGYDNGASYQGRREKDDNLNLAMAVGDILERDGYDVEYTRTDDVYDSPSQKARIANESGADFFVSIHRNSSPTPNQYNGVQTLVYDNSGIKQTMAENVNKELEKVGYRNINVPARPNLTVLRRTQMPAILVEAGFINSDTDNQLFDSKFEETAEAIARGISETIQDAGLQASASRQSPDSAAYVNAMADMNNGNGMDTMPIEPGNGNQNGMTPGNGSQNGMTPGNGSQNGMMPGNGSQNGADITPEQWNGNQTGDMQENVPNNGANNNTNNNGMNNTSPESTYYQVLVGVYDNFGAARYQLNRLVNEGYYAEIYEQGARYQLRIGRYDDIESALSAQRQLRDAGYNTLIVRGDI